MLDPTALQRALPPGSMRHTTWLFTPQAQRDVIAALFILESELRDSARATHDVAHVRLNWWHEEIQRLTRAQAQHPVTQVLQAAALRNAHANASTMNWQMLEHMLSSAAQELARATFETEAELATYFEHSTGALCRMALQLNHPLATPQQLQWATQLGAFVRQVETLRDMPTDFHDGRLYLPLHALDELGINFAQLQQASWPKVLLQWLRQRTEPLQRHYQQLHAVSVRQPNSELRSQLVLSALHAGLCRKIPASLVQANIQAVELTSLRKLWTAWRTAISA